MASRTYAAAVYSNQFKYLPSGWNWIATEHEAMLPPALDSAALRSMDVSEQSEFQFSLEETRSSRPAPIAPSPAPSGFFLRAREVAIHLRPFVAKILRGNPRRRAPRILRTPLGIFLGGGLEAHDCGQVEGERKKILSACTFFACEIGDHAVCLGLRISLDF